MPTDRPGLADQGSRSVIGADAWPSVTTSACQPSHIPLSEHGRAPDWHCSAGNLGSVLGATRDPGPKKRLTAR